MKKSRMTSMYRRWFKRCLDILLASFALALLVPIFIALAILIPLDSKGPVFFRQNRVGMNCRNIIVYKFRTMTNIKRDVGNKPILGHAEGVTRIGYYLRRYKIDELPQVISVLTGDMSIIGPRPSVPEQLEQMNNKEKERYSVRPGLTGLAQVSGNIHLPWERRFEFDLQYIARISLLNDCKIIIRTFFLIVKGEAYYVDKPLKIS